MAVDHAKHYTMTKKFYVFGDESINANHVVYALVIVPVEMVEKIENIFAEVKERHGANRSSRFHCRVLFQKDARGKSPWAHLNDRQAYDFAFQVCTALAGQGIGTIVGHVNRNTAPLEHQGVGSIPSVPITNAKQLIPDAYQSAVCRLMFDPMYKDQCEFWIEPNRDPINWGAGRRQVGGLLSSTRIDLVAKTLEKLFVAENSQSKEWHSLLEIADLLAYCTSRYMATNTVYPKRYGDNVIAAIYKSMAPIVNSMVNISGSPEGVLEGFSYIKKNVPKSRG
jgi:hypothetical protein